MEETSFTIKYGLSKRFLERVIVDFLNFSYISQKSLKHLGILNLHEVPAVE